MRLKKTALFFITTLTLFPFMAQSGEYKIILQQIIDIKGAGDWIDADPSYSTWETIDGTRSCQLWEPVIDKQTSDFEQQRDCTVEQIRDKTTREYNTTLDEYRNLNTTEQQRTHTLSTPETRLINVATSSWGDSGSVYECSDWTPDTDTAFENETVDQSRDCQQDKQRTVDYTTDGETLDTVTQTQTVSVEETRSVSGTKAMYASCKAINDNNAGDGDGLYTIFPNNNDGFDVYCDMTTNGGGWTRLTRSLVQERFNTSFNEKMGYGEWRNNKLVAGDTSDAGDTDVIVNIDLPFEYNEFYLNNFYWQDIDTGNNDTWDTFVNMISENYADDFVPPTRNRGDITIGTSDATSATLSFYNEHGGKMENGASFKVPIDKQVFANPLSSTTLTFRAMEEGSQDEEAYIWSTGTIWIR